MLRYTKWTSSEHGPGYTLPSPAAVEALASPSASLSLETPAGERLLGSVGWGLLGGEPVAVRPTLILIR
jgi:hypothetical protein